MLTTTEPPAGLKLYELAAWERELLSRLDAAESPEELPKPEEVDSLCANIASKVEGCCRLYRSAVAEAEAIKAEADRLAARAKTAADKAEWLKRYMHGCLAVAGESKMSAGIFKLAITPNSAPSVFCTVDATTLPAEFQKATVQVDKTAILEAFKAGQTLPDGVDVIKGTHLRIR